MSFALAAALRVVFRDPNGSTAGTFTPLGGQPQPVRVLRASTSDRIAGGTSTFGAQGDPDTAEIMAREVPAKPAKGSRVFFDGRSRKVAASTATKNGLSWTLTLEPI